MSQGTRPNNNLGDFFTNLTNNSKPASNLAYNFNKKTPNVNVLPRANSPPKDSSPFSSIFGLFQTPKNAPPPSVGLPSSPSRATPVAPSPAAGNFHVSGSVIVFVVLTSVLLLFLYGYRKEIAAGISNIGQNIRELFNKPAAPPIIVKNDPSEYVTESPYPPQDEKIVKATSDNNRSLDIIDRLIPYGNPEVFNISKNKFTYYDAEPLCKALGAELATYDQVKEAWSKGADWCNYGWVKGQAAVYPTQKETWDRVQSGPEGTQGSCGVPGLNGGYFDNPELKFGVNCYGVKPDQSEHDQQMLMKKGAIPLSVPALEIDRRINDFKNEASEIGVMPFNTNKWSTI